MAGRVPAALVASCLASCLALAPAPAAPAEEASTVPEKAPSLEGKAALRARLARQGPVRLVEGRFLQTRRSPLLAEPLVSAGAFRLRAPGYAHWVVENPAPLVLEVDGDRIRAGRPGALREVPQRGSAGALRALLVLFLGTGTGSEIPLGVAVGEDTNTFRLYPEKGGMPGLDRIDVRFAAGGGPEHLELHESDGGVLAIRLMDVRVNLASDTGGQP